MYTFASDPAAGFSYLGRPGCVGGLTVDEDDDEAHVMSTREEEKEKEKELKKSWIGNVETRWAFVRKASG